MKLESRQLAQIFVNLTEEMDGADLNRAAQAFVELLADRKELYRYRDIIRAIDSVWKQKHGAANITIASAHPLSKSAKEVLLKKAQGATITEEVEKDLIGGAKIRIDDKIIDGSLAGFLGKLKHRLSEAA